MTEKSPSDVPFEMAPEELDRRLKAGTAPVIIDVRNPEEYAICKLPGSKLIPLGELPQRLAELDPEQEIVVHCKLGGRATQAVAFLRQQGFSHARNLTGGILAWAAQIDPTLRTY